MVENLFLQVNGGLIVFARLISFFLFAPGFSFESIPARIRFLLAFSLCVPLSGFLPHNDLSLERFISELILGCFLGCVFRFFVESVLSIMGVIAAQNMLTNTMLRDLSGSMRDVITGFFHLYFIVILLGSGSHFWFVKILLKSFLVLDMVSVQAFSDIPLLLLKGLGEGAKLGFSLSMPFVFFSLFYALFLGAFNRLIPMLPVFFVGQPLSVGVFWMTCLLSMRSIHTQFIQCFSKFCENFW